MRPLSIRAKQEGFTATEMMVVVLILAILAAFALPAMNAMIRTQKVRSAAYDLFADLTYARNQAITLGRDITITSTSGTNWVNGWSLTDPNGVVLRQVGAYSTGLVFTGTVPTLTFDRTGHASAITQFSIVPTDSGATDAQKRCIKMTVSGRPNSITGPCP